MKVEFKPLQEEHLSILSKWLKEPHVAEFWQETEDENEFREKFLNTLPKRGVTPFIVILNAKPVGYIQHYEARNVGSGWWPDAKEGTFGIDQFIGDPMMINKGYGTTIIRKFVENLFENPKAKEIITDPDPKNHRAIRAYEKVGFFRVGEIKTPGGDALLLCLNRSACQQSSASKMIPVPGGKISALSFGEGRPIIFLHGGPGDTHDYMRRMAKPLFQDFQCIFFDQRGTGGSDNFERKPELFGIESLFEDLKAVQEHFQADNAMLVGHSWGAMYALYACFRYPGRFKKAALLNMGPIDAEMEKATSEHLLSVLSDVEKTEWNNLRRERNQARDERSFDRVKALDKELMRLRVKAWLFNPSLREAFLTEYFQDPPPDREINKLIWEAQHGWFSWEQLNILQTHTWLCVGANDSVPVAQAQRIAEIAPNARVTVYENCGHIPWLEYPDRFYRELRSFFGAAHY